MKRGIQADQIAYEISEAEKDFDFLNQQLNTCTDEKDSICIIEEIDKIKRKLYRLKMCN